MTMEREQGDPDWWPPRESAAMPNIEVPQQMVALSHPVGEDIKCGRCKRDGACFQCTPTIFGYGDLCVDCHDFVKAVMLELQRAIKKFPEAKVAAMITTLNEAP